MESIRKYFLENSDHNKSGENDQMRDTVRDSHVFAELGSTAARNPMKSWGPFYWEYVPTRQYSSEAKVIQYHSMTLASLSLFGVMALKICLKKGMLTIK